ncbi:hypothetical protein DNTS_014257, partial [Danionella cerebrum]
MENRDKWTDVEVNVLLKFYAREEMQRDFVGNKRNKIFACISAQLAALGINHTAKQCREKIKKLKQDYKRIKDYNNKSGSVRKTSKWYKLLDSTLGHKPTYAGSSAVGQSAGFLETFSPESFNLAPGFKAEEGTAECSFVAESEFIGDAHMISTSAYSSPSSQSSPPHVTPGIRTSEDADVLSLVKEMLEQEEENRRQSYTQMQILVNVLKEQIQREVQEREQLREEAAKTRRQQAAFMERLLTTVNRLVCRSQSIQLSEDICAQETREVGCQCSTPVMRSVGVQVECSPNRTKRQ